jgi:membrane protease YdiL (CAAX protease family)
MEPETQPTLQEELPTTDTEAQKASRLRRIFFDKQGLRTVWSLLSFLTLYIAFCFLVGFSFMRLHLISKNWMTDFTPYAAFFAELIPFVAMVGAASLVALFERRRSILDYNLTGPRRIPHFFGGLAAGFVALSALIGALAWGGWLQLGPVALTPAAIFKYGALWAATFLLVGCVEEGIFRCFLLSTLTRGMTFRKAVVIVAALCLDLLLTGKGNGVSGIYVLALLGLIPCLLLHLRKSESVGFWHATWVTSTLFGFVHTFNPGETWVGIAQVEFIGFVFCVSVWLTGSAWWAIGCHAAWDWAETFFYGTADSGRVGADHFLTTSPAGNVLLSGGADGPEGSLLVLGVLALLLAALIVIYGRKGKSTVRSAQTAL